MKKFIVALLAFALVFAFTSCDNEAQGPTDDWDGIGVRIARHTIPDELGEGATCEGNWDHVKSATYADGVVTVEADLYDMAEYASTNPDQGKHKWFALFISVGDFAEDDSLRINESITLEQAREGDTEKYEAVFAEDADKAMAANEFVFWAKADDPGSITLSRNGATPLTIQVKVEDVDLVSSSDDFISAIKAGDKKVALADNVTLTEKVNFTKSVDIDLNGKTLSTDLDLNINENAAEDPSVVDVTISNGKLVLNSNSITHGTLRLYTNSNVTLDDVEYTTNATGIFFRQTNANAKAVIKDSTITSTGAYAIGTNASKEESENMIVEIENSTISAAKEGSTGILFNVGGGVTIKNSTVIGGKQAMIARGGTHSFTDTKFVAEDALAASDDEYLDKDWDTGNGVPCAALVVGNRNSGNSYPYGTTVTLEGVTFEAPEGVYEIYVYENKEEEAVIVDGFVPTLPFVNEKDTMNGATYEVRVKK